MTGTPVLLVGSVSEPDAESTFRALAEHLGERAPRIPDGEVGDRFYWIQFQRDKFDQTAGLHRVGDTPFYIRDRFDGRPFALDEGVNAVTLRFPSLGYADAALDSWETFDRLQREGVIPAGARFQVSLPTPAGVIGSFFVPEARAAVERVYAAAIFGELDRILAGIPHERLAIQWDTALEFAFLEGVEVRGRRIEPWFGTTHEEILEGVLERAARGSGLVPTGVELGFHLCYGDVEEQHFVEPTDAGVLAEVARGILERSPRPVDWIHLPVPIERDDAGFFAPLDGIAWGDTTVFLGLVHHEDGVDGAVRRATVARGFVPEFGIATECGFGRGPRERTVPLLDLHAEIADRLGGSAEILGE